MAREGKNWNANTYEAELVEQKQYKVIRHLLHLWRKL